MELERARSVDEALALAPEVGIPHQNVVVGDAAGHIAWTIFGRIPADTTGKRARIGGARGQPRPSTRRSSIRRSDGCGPPTHA